MAAHAYREIGTGDNTPLDLQLDLLVDGELPEDQRQAVLVNTERQGNWRELALRFLQRQTEQETVQALMTGGSVVPAELAPGAARWTRGAVLGRLGWAPMLTTAAGLLIATTSALLTLYAVRPVGSQTGTPLAEFQTSLPGDVLSWDGAVPVSVPMVRTGDDARVFPVSNEAEDAPNKKAVIIQSNGRGGFIMIPVSTSQNGKVY